MGYTKTQQARLLAGLCFQCGAERTGKGTTNRLCARCAQGKRENERARKERNKETLRPIEAAKHWARLKKRIASGVCVTCKGPRTGRKATAYRCGKCAARQKGWQEAYEQRERNKAMGYTPGDGRNKAPKPTGLRARQFGVREGGAFYFRLVLDRDSYDGLVALRQRYRDAETRAGRDWQTHQLSRLVREVILRYEPSRVGIAPRKHRLLIEKIANLSLDGRTRAVLERQAARSFGGNKSATLRAMLAGCQGIRRAFTGRVGMRGR